jgi:hypothetical protein
MNLKRKNLVSLKIYQSDDKENEEKVQVIDFGPNQNFIKII